VPKVNRRRTAVVPSVEPLDRRTLLSATLRPDIMYPGLFALELTGSARNDAIVVKPVAGDGRAIRVYGVEGVEDGTVFRDLWHFSVHAGDGDDVIDVHSDLMCWISGDAGNDRLVDHQRVDGFGGGDGDDTIIGGDGPNTASDIFPGKGHDVLKLDGASYAAIFFRSSDDAPGSHGVDTVLIDGRPARHADYYGGSVGTVEVNAGPKTIPSDPDVVDEYMGFTDGTVEQPEYENAYVTPDGLAGTYVLHVFGSGGADDIVVRRTRSGPTRGYQDLAVAGVPGVPDGTVFRKVQKVVINGLSGSDRIELDAAVQSTVFGAAGDDTIMAVDRADDLFGGAGDDVISFTVGTQYVDGWTGDDVITFRAAAYPPPWAIIVRPGDGDDVVDTAGSALIVVAADTAGEDADGHDAFLINGEEAKKAQVKRSAKAANRLIVTAKKLTKAALLKKLQATRAR
jgi:Ca2+-binding RTX toxin-like protein